MKGGHPCLTYSVKFWKRFEEGKILTRQRIKNNMDGFGYLTEEEIDAFVAKTPETDSSIKPKEEKTYTQKYFDPDYVTKSYSETPESLEIREVYAKLEEEKMRRKKSIEKWVKIGFGFMAIVIVFALIMVLFGQIQLPLSDSPSPFQSTVPIISLSPSVSPYAFSSSTPIPSPTITQSTSSLTPTVAPSATSSAQNQETLVNYAISLINSDRQQYGLQNVTLSSINSGQLHAEDMLKNGYFSHWDTNGYKPYMRYTLAGGNGAIAENCAWQWESGSLFDIDAKSTLKDLEWSMMYDDAASNWGHKDNILNPLHNKVSIGIAYDSHKVYLVQDFEDDYVEWNVLSFSNNQVTMQGTITQTNLTLSQVGINYDKVANLTVQHLSNSPYQDGYDSGTYVGMVVTPPPTGSYYSQPEKGIMIIATTWSQTGQNFDIAFDLSSASAQSGSGVYTLYLWTDNNSYLTTYSVWIE